MPEYDEYHCTSPRKYRLALTDFRVCGKVQVRFVLMRLLKRVHLRKRIGTLFGTFSSFLDTRYSVEGSSRHNRFSFTTYAFSRASKSQRDYPFSCCISAAFRKLICIFRSIVCIYVRIGSHMASNLSGGTSHWRKMAWVHDFMRVEKEGTEFSVC